MIELVTPVYQGLFLLFVIVCTTVGIVALMWAMFELALRLWYRGVAAHTIFDAVQEVRRKEREQLARSFGTPRDG